MQGWQVCHVLQTQAIACAWSHCCTLSHDAALRRPGKFGHAAHFTLRCGCQKPDGSYQQPLVALVCNFGGEGDDLNTPLAHSQVRLCQA